jgi:hypothetical protein
LSHNEWKDLGGSADRLQQLAGDGQCRIAIRTDVASYYERIYQHNLINLLHASGCSVALVSPLEKLLSAWTERDSHGLLQGMFPSDFLGNFYLCGLDADLALREVPSVRFVDDLYVFTPSYESALSALVDLTRYLRDEGLLLNEGKTDVLPADRLVAEETELDRRFKDAYEEIAAVDAPAPSYGFQAIYEEREDAGSMDEPNMADILEAENRLLATMALFRERGEGGRLQQERIDKFCLPVFAAYSLPVAGSDATVGMRERPHLAHLYASYLAALTPWHSEITGTIVEQVQPEVLPYDWQSMWALAAVLPAPSLPSAEWVEQALRLLRDGRRSVGLRAVAALFAAKFGNAAQRRLIRLHYSDESAPYVRSAILFAARFFPKNERDTCLSGWGGHSTTNALIAIAVKRLEQ